MSRSVIMPAGFWWGTGASAYQVEGAWDADGKGPSIWDTAMHGPGGPPTPDGSSGDVAIDQYHRLDEDLDLLGQLGAKVHRFSISWPRIMPDGRGLNPAGFGHYDRMVDGLLSRGLVPVANLFHWELPQALEDEGGWLHRDTACRFADYAAAVSEHLGDRMAQWYTMNEPTHPTLGGYVAGVLPPFRTEGAAGLASVHHLLLAHGLAVEGLRANSPAPVGIILSMAGVRPATKHPDDQAAARIASELMDGVFLDPILRGEHLPGLVRALGPTVHDGDLAKISAPLDLLGVNWYSSYTVAAPERAARHLAEAPQRWQIYSTLGDHTGKLGFVVVPQPGTTWGAAHRQITPGGLSEVLDWLAAEYPGHPPVVISENGLGLVDRPDENGLVDDQTRIEFLRTNLADLHAAIQRGTDVRGFWVWSAWDNLQWNAGFSQRFGLVHVDQHTLQRTPKSSFDWFAQIVADNGLSEAEVNRLADDDYTGELLPVGAPNARDLGGLPVATGGRIKSALMFRSGRIDQLDESDAAALAACGLRTVVDLRGDHEQRSMPDPQIGQASHLRMPLGTELRPADLAQFKIETFYRHMVENNGSQIAELFNALARPGALPALLHCTAGKDRTGVVVILLLSLLGVPDEVVASNYAASADLLDGQFRAALEAHITAAGEPGLAMGALDSPAWLAKFVLDEARLASCTVQGWLEDHGMAPETADMLRQLLTDTRP
ncbi:MAG: family 1 glycosylhydrolase [Propionibacteriaceae bacterium]|nr:family 1 glycosylhydrolase [Propionibacteriaceae bacterium]